MLEKRPRSTEPKLSEADIGKLSTWAILWKVPGLEERVQIRFSKRMYRTLGRYLPGRHEIRLAAFLTESGWEDLYNEVLCHEAAHAACYERFGWNGRPHGKEWKALMSDAGFVPRARLPQSPALRDVVLARQTARTKSRKTRKRPQRRRRAGAWERLRQIFDEGA